MTTHGPLDRDHLVSVEGLGEGTFRPAGPRRAHDLIVFDKRHPPRDGKNRPLSYCRRG
jgi:hypothetical protein